jgi:cardiolipin synthase
MQRTFANVFALSNRENPMAKRICFALVAVSFLVLSACSVHKPVHYDLPEIKFTVNDPQFPRAVAGLLNYPLTPGNTVTTLINGDQIFPAMLDAIASAKTSITCETYLYWSGDIGQKFADALCQRAKAGVKVHLLMDWFGSESWIGNRNTINEKYVSQLKEAGVQVCTYHPFSPFDPTTWPQVNQRTHRKILVIDGRIAFTGGVGIANEWTGNAQDPDHWRDNHYRVEGPIVSQLQAAFLEDWAEACGKILAGDDYFPELTTKGDMWAQVYSSSANGGSQNMQLLNLLSIAAAGKSIRIESAYFVPDPVTEAAFVTARKRGVTIEIIVPGDNIDEKIVRDASRARWNILLEAGVEIYEYQPTMLHNKLMIVDDVWVSVGSANQDNRSYRINGEANLNVLDKKFAAGQIELFEADKKQSRRITLEEWRNRPWQERLRAALAEFLRQEL